MINKVILKNAATYTQAVEIEPSEINYFYGSNGSGKTTLSKVIADESAFSHCSLLWQVTPIETLVYNKDFVKTHFSQSNSIKGIFTLGKDATEAKKFIEQTKLDIEAHTTALISLNTSLEQKNTVATELMEGIIKKCWSIKDKYQDDFREAYTGFIGSKKAFFERCQKEDKNTSALLSLDDIKGKCDRIFNKAIQVYDQIPELVLPDLHVIECHAILSTKIVGKEDVPIGALIAKLSNSDWIKQGLGYLEQTKSHCPFCQQPVESVLKSEIESVFDETYKQKIKELEAFKTSYIQEISHIIERLKQITDSAIKIIDFSELKAHVRLLEEEYKNNLDTINKKIKAPSIVVQLKSLSTDIAKAYEYVNSYRTTIETNNSTSNNIGNEQKTLISEIWHFIVNELETDLNTYKKKMTGVEAGKQNIQEQINQRKIDKQNLEKQIKEKEAAITSVIHTKNEINKILKSFGFTNFSISETDNGYYKIIRQDGVDAKETLSEGEYTFITFLYFYQLLKGSIKESGLSGDKIVVIDDPISSLDSNVLFIVSNLVKEILKDCRNKQNGIKQAFILTHNIYFHKEVTFKGSRQGTWKEESFWIIRNLNNQSSIIKHDANPIQTTYELLWREVKYPELINKATIFNTLRRILEYYFNIIGGLDYEKSIDEFQGEEKLIFKSLFSWINDGSHFINDDLVVYTEPETIEKQLNIFREIFKKLKHESHYNMMMGIENV